MLVFLEDGLVLLILLTDSLNGEIIFGSTAATDTGVLLATG